MAHPNEPELKPTRKQPHSSSATAPPPNPRSPPLLPPTFPYPIALRRGAVPTSSALSIRLSSRSTRCHLHSTRPSCALSSRGCSQRIPSSGRRSMPSSGCDTSESICRSRRDTVRSTQTRTRNISPSPPLSFHAHKHTHTRANTNTNTNTDMVTTHEHGNEITTHEHGHEPSVIALATLTPPPPPPPMTSRCAHCLKRRRACRRHRRAAAPPRLGWVTAPCSTIRGQCEPRARLTLSDPPRAPLALLDTPRDARHAATAAAGLSCARSVRRTGGYLKRTSR